MEYTQTEDNKQYTSLRITKELHKKLREEAKKSSTIFYHFTDNLIRKALENNDRS